MNITCLSYANHLEFGLVGCRLAVPEMQTILGYLEDSLHELEYVRRSERETAREEEPINDGCLVARSPGHHPGRRHSTPFSTD